MSKPKVSKHATKISNQQSSKSPEEHEAPKATPTNTSSAKPAAADIPSAAESNGSSTAVLVANEVKAGLGNAPNAPNAVDLAEKVKELVRLAQEQGYLTYND